MIDEHVLSKSRKQGRDVDSAEAKVDDLKYATADLEQDMREELEGHFDSTALELETVSISPYKKDIDVTSVSLL